ncbi:MAG: bactofilin family protein [Thermoplasmatota archaeon]
MATGSGSGPGNGSGNGNGNGSGGGNGNGNGPGNGLAPGGGNGSGHGPRAALHSIKIDVPTPYVDALIQRFHSVGWPAHDTGRTVTTDEGDEWLSTLQVDLDGNLPAGSAGSGSIVQPAAVAAPLPPPPSASMVDSTRRAAGLPSPATYAAPAAIPFVRESLFTTGDCYVGDELELDADLSATGSVTVGRRATVLGRVHAGADLHLLDGAVVHDASCAGRLFLSPQAQVTGSIQAAQGVVPRPSG